jgi:multiple sugar transport system ATP-binding protein
MVRSVERLGGETYIYLQPSAGTDLTVHASGDVVVSNGDRISVSFAADKCHLFGENGEAFPH